MNDEVLGDIAIEKTCKDNFGVELTINEIIARDISTGQSSTATVFKATNGQVFVFIASRGSQVLSDVQKIVLRMQCEADVLYPPHGEQVYFDRIGREKFMALFPGKHIVSDDDLRHYRGLASYNPALVRLSRIKGEIRAYDDHLKTWRKVKDYHYSRIATI